MSDGLSRRPFRFYFCINLSVRNHILPALSHSGGIVAQTIAAAAAGIISGGVEVNRKETEEVRSFEGIPAIDSYTLRVFPPTVMSDHVISNLPTVMVWDHLFNGHVFKPPSTTLSDARCGNHCRLRT